MFAPNQPVIAFGQIGNRVRNPANAGFVFVVHHIKQWADMQAADIDMAKHAVIKALGIQ